jgi:hypothetical protein
MKRGEGENVCAYQYYSAVSVARVNATVCAQGRALVLQRVCLKRSVRALEEQLMVRRR